MRKLRYTAFIVLMISLSGCGQRGPLTLPEPAEENQNTSFAEPENRE